MMKMKVYEVGVKHIDGRAKFCVLLVEAEDGTAVEIPVTHLTDHALVEALESGGALLRRWPR